MARNKEGTTESYAGRVGRKFLDLYGIVRGSVEKFLSDGSMIRANAIAYSVAISIIPLLTVLVKYAEVDQETIRTNIARFMSAYGVSESSELLTILDQILKRANAIAGVGSIFMIFAATNILRHTEDAFNFIYRAEKARPFLYRFSIYIASLVVLPGAGILFGSAFRYYLDRLSPPSVTGLDLIPRGSVAVGTQGIVRIQNNVGVQTVDLNAKVDRTAPYRTIYFDLRSKSYGHYWELPGNKGDVPVVPRTLEGKDFASLRRVAASGDTISIITSTGVLFYSLDRGTTWNYYIFAFRSESAIRHPILEDILALDRGRFLMLATSGSHSVLVSMQEDSFRMQELGSVFHHIQETASADGKSSDIYLTGNGRYYLSHDDGDKWEGPIEEKFGNRILPINTVARLGDDRIAFAGNDASLWIHERDLVAYPDTRATVDQNVDRMALLGRDKLLMYGKGQLFRVSVDNGRTWLLPEQDIFRSITFHAHVRLPDGSLLLGGDNNTILRIRHPVVTGKKDLSGHPMVRFDVTTLSRYETWKVRTLKVLLYSILLFAVFAAVFSAYVFFPNTYVRLDAAAWGGAITSTALLLFALGFQRWIRMFSSTAYIYGVWAVIPVGLLVILISNQIILFGLEISYVIQYPHLYRRKLQDEESGENLYWTALLMVLLVYRVLYEDSRPLSDGYLERFFGPEGVSLRTARKRLLAGGIIAYDPGKNEYYPIKPPGDLRLVEIHNVLFDTVLQPTRLTIPQPLLAHVERMAGKMRSAVHRSPGKTTIKDLLPLFNMKSADARKNRKKR